MKFKVSRTSLWNGKKPCEEAYLCYWNVFEIRTCNEVVFNSLHSQDEGRWRDKGKNHTVLKNGDIKRQIDDKEFWTVNIKSLKELMTFVKKYDEVVLCDDSIEIYDDYRE